MKLFDRIKFATATTGTSDIAVGAGVDSSTAGDGLTPAEAGVSNGDVFPYIIVDGGSFAYGLGSYSTSGPLLARDANERNWNGTTLATGKLSLSGAAIVMCSPRAADLLLQGTHTMPIPAAAMYPRVTGGAAYGGFETTTNRINVKTLDFDAATAEYAQIAVPMPKNWDRSTISVQFLWRASSGTGNVVWGAQAVAMSDDDVLDAAFGTAVTVTDGLTATTDLMASTYTAAITVAGSPASEDLVLLQVYRDAANGSDTFSADACLVGIRVKYGVNAGNDD